MSAHYEPKGSAKLSRIRGEQGPTMTGYGVALVGLLAGGSPLSQGCSKHGPSPVQGRNPKPEGRKKAETRSPEFTSNAARQSRNRNQARLNAETQRARRNAEEKALFFLPSLRPSANLCVSALILRSLRTISTIAVERRRSPSDQ